MYCTLFDRTYMYSTISIPCSFYCKQAWIEPDLSEASVNSSIQFHFSHLIFIQQGLSIKSTHYFMFWCLPVFVLSHACHDNYWETFQVLFHRSCQSLDGFFFLEYRLWILRKNRFKRRLKYIYLASTSYRLSWILPASFCLFEITESLETQQPIISNGNMTEKWS